MDKNIDEFVEKVKIEMPKNEIHGKVNNRLNIEVSLDTEELVKKIDILAHYFYELSFVLGAMRRDLRRIDEETESGD